MALGACGGGGSGDDDVMFVDAGSTFDAGLAACNPVTQQGCDPGQKCTQVTYQDDPFLGKTECVPDGTVAAGGACTAGAAGADTGYDDCVGGYYCLGGACTEICTSNPADTCSGDASACVLFADLFDDLGTDAMVGLCEPTCDPVAQDCTDTAQGCYLQVTAGVGTCARVPMPAAELGQDEACYGPMAGTCYLNGCSKGYQSLEPSENSATADSLCASFCSPASTTKDAPAGAAGTDPNNCGIGRLGSTAIAGPHECRFVQSFYNGADAVADTVGFCVATATWSSCTDFDPLAMVDSYNTAFNAAAAGAKDQAGSDALDTFCELDATTMTYNNVACQGFGCYSAVDRDAWQAMFLTEGAKHRLPNVVQQLRNGVAK